MALLTLTFCRNLFTFGIEYFAMEALLHIRWSRWLHWFWGKITNFWTNADRIVIEYPHILWGGWVMVHKHFDYWRERERTLNHIFNNQQRFKELFHLNLNLSFSYANGFCWIKNMISKAFLGMKEVYWI